MSHLPDQSSLPFSDRDPEIDAVKDERCPACDGRARLLSRQGRNVEWKCIRCGQEFSVYRPGPGRGGAA
jgi:ribosomal protein L37AE/L43A